MALLALGLLAFSASASEAARKTWKDAQASVGSGHSFSGMASYYGNESGSRTASGQRFNQHAMTAAHRTLPFGTRLKVTHGGRSVTVTVNDRGPFIRGRCSTCPRARSQAIANKTQHRPRVGRVSAEVQ